MINNCVISSNSSHGGVERRKKSSLLVQRLTGGGRDEVTSYLSLSSHERHCMQAACKQRSLGFERVQLFRERALLERRNVPPHWKPQGFSSHSYCWHWQKCFAQFPLCTCKFPQGTFENLGDNHPRTILVHSLGLRAGEMLFQAYLKVDESTGKTSHRSPCGFAGLLSLLALWVSTPIPPNIPQHMMQWKLWLKPADHNA